MANIAAPVPAPTKIPKGKVLAWSLWDWGSAAFNSVVVTFVFSVWVTSEAFVEPGADVQSVTAQHTTWLSWGLALAGVVIALIAPAQGARADVEGKRKRTLGLYTALTAVTLVAMFFVQPKPGSMGANVMFAVVLMSLGQIFFELAEVNYNGMVNRVSTPATVGKVSGFGWAMGYLGGIVLLAVLYVGLINGDTHWFGISEAGGMNMRIVVLVAAAWYSAFALPLFFAVPEGEAAGTEPGGAGKAAKVGFFESYKLLFRHLAKLWREDRNVVKFYIASAIFRDGLAGVFQYGGILAGNAFGFSTQEVLIFAIAANVIAGVATLVFGFFDDRIGPKRVIEISLWGIVIAGLAVFGLHAGLHVTLFSWHLNMTATQVFWVFGLLLCVFVGPAQSASRSFLARVVPSGRDSEYFGLYATTGRAASFLAPALFGLFVSIGGRQYWGILGIVLVVAVGLGLLVPVKSQHKAAVTL